MAKRDRVAELRDRLGRIADQDTRLIVAVNRFADFSTQELEGFLAMPEAAFPMHGFKSKREVRLAIMGNLPKKQWPAALQAAHERTGYFIRKEEAQAERGELTVVVLPSIAAGDTPMVVKRRDARGQIVEIEEAKLLPEQKDGDG